MVKLFYGISIVFKIDQPNKETIDLVTTQAHLQCMDNYVYKDVHFFVGVYQKEVDFQ